MPTLRRAAAFPMVLSAIVISLAAGLHAPGECSAIPLGGRVPPLPGTLLTGKKKVLPDSTRGRGLVLLLGFTYASRHDVEAWAARWRRDFGADTSVACYEIPVIGGAGRIARPFINRGMRRGTPRELHERVMTVYGHTKEWKRHVGFAEPDVAYVLLVDARGRLAWRGRGPLADSLYLRLEEQVRLLER